MKTTLELDDLLFVAAKKRAAELRIPLRRLVENGLRKELDSLAKRKKPAKLKLHTVGGGTWLVDLSSREKMMEGLDRDL
ncbi:MAG: hypothetical protein IT381_19305 [Deltaproteobacteria bacterium]|nr:hypothetical protein [Deltaproteobacteria bacterium]